MPITEINILKYPKPISNHNWTVETRPKIDIYCPTYNHQSFIKQTIESFLSQETCFPVHILFHDDASTDNTVEIIREYHNRFPNLIRFITQSENQLSKGIKPWLFILPHVTGKFLAICDGDNY